MPCYAQGSLMAPNEDFFMPLSRRRRQGSGLVEEKMEAKDHEVKAQGAKPQAAASLRTSSKRVRLQKNRQVEKPLLEGDVPVTRQLTFTVNEKSSSLASLPLKEPSPSIPGNVIESVGLDLRTESILASQENARLNAGKAPHPFFSRQRVSSLKSTFLVDETATCQGEYLQPSPPMHVTQTSESAQDERTEIERMWLGWKFIPSVVNEGCKEEKACNVDQKRCVLMQGFLPSRPVQHEGRNGLNALSAGPGQLHIEEAPSSGNESTPFHEALKDLLIYMQTSKQKAEAAGDQSQPAEDARWHGMIFSFEELENKLEWYNSHHDTTLRSAENFTTSQLDADAEVLSLARNLLWTDLYQPKSSKEVCGNGTEVESLRGWLHLWQQKMSGQFKSCENVNKESNREEEMKYDSDIGWSDDETGSDDDDTGLHNTLLITGPEGCGKSAAVYACAREEGFTVIEVNASDYRSGTLIKHKFGEAMESHGLREVPQAAGGSPQQFSKMGIKEQDTNLEQLKQVAFKQQRELLKRKFVGSSPMKSCRETPISSQDMDSHTTGKTIILFEDVDKHFEEDKGFLTALAQLSKVAKRPIILTSNKREPGLPQLLAKCRINLHYPTAEELIFHACMVCIAEGVSCSPWIVGRIVDSCRFDLRKVIMALQFWGQGNVSLWQPCVQSMSGCFPKSFDDLEQDNKLVIQGTIGLESEKCLNLRAPDRSSNMAPDDMQDERHSQMKRSFYLWESDARRLFELDVHHLVLPKVVSCSLACPLSLFVADKICAAASQRETYVSEFAARGAEEQARMKKSLKKAQDALRRVPRPKSKALEDSVDIDSVDSPIECREMQHSCAESLVDSPIKSLRAAKSLARSPLKPKRLLQRSLVLCDSDGEDEQALQMQPGINSGLGHKSISDTEAMVSGAQAIMINVEDSSPFNVVSEGLEDVEGTPSRIEAVMTIKRKRLTKKVSRQIKLESLSSDVSKDLTGNVLETGEQMDVFGKPLSSECNFASHEFSPMVITEGSHSILVDDLAGTETSGGNFIIQAYLDTLAANFPDRLDTDSFDPVKDTWASLRKSKDSLKSLVEHSHNSDHVTSSLADLLDVISVSDVMSGVQTEEFRDAQWSLDGALSQVWEGNVGHCSDWDGCQEMASQLVCRGLQHSISGLPAVEQSGNDLPILSCVLEGAKDAPAIGAFLARDFKTAANLCRSSHKNRTLDEDYLAVHPTRQKEMQARLEAVVRTAVFPRGRVSRSSFVDYSAYLARMSQSEEVRRSSECRLRTHRFNHCLNSKLSMSQSDITDLLMHSTFGRR